MYDIGAICVIRKLYNYYKLDTSKHYSLGDSNIYHTENIILLLVVKIETQIALKIINKFTKEMLKDDKIK